ncbi:sulfatase-like hydrolase/transferase [bacterium]|nr:sulfatase-like hydrolase/transferase [bacterium]
MRKLIVLSFWVGFLVIALELLFVLLQPLKVSPFEFVLFLVYGCIGFGLLCSAATFLWNLIALRLTSDQRMKSGSAVAIPIALFLSFRIALVMRTAGLHFSWSIVGTLLLISFLTWSFNRLIRRVSLLENVRPWQVLSGFLLLICILFSFWNRSRIATQDASAKGKPNILLISVDTLRRDRLGCYGYQAARTPHIDALARQSVLFEDAVSPIPLTGPSHVTMLTGLYPHRHGVPANGIRLSKNLITVPETLAKAGYETAAFVSGWTLKNDSVGLSTKFAHYGEDFSCTRIFPDSILKLTVPRVLVRLTGSVIGYHLEHRERPAEATTRDVLSWLSGKRNRPFFLMVHYFDPHGPHIDPSNVTSSHRDTAAVFDYSQPAEIKRQILSDPSRVERVKQAYDREISYTDSQFGLLMDKLKELKLDQNTVVIFTADHGESLTEHGWYFDHGEYLYETCVLVPLLIRFPGKSQMKTRISHQVRLVDLAPTILEITGQKMANKIDGESLIPILKGTESQPRVSFGELQQGSGDSSRSRYYVRMNGYKLIWNFDRRELTHPVPAYEELYDLSSDPNEEHNLISTAPPVLEYLRSAMKSRLPQRLYDLQSPESDVREQLEALGYL